MSLLFSMNLCPKYVCMSSFSHDLPFEVCECPIARHTHPCGVLQYKGTLSERCVDRDGHRIMDWYWIMDWCWKQVVIYLKRLFFINATRAAGQGRLSKVEAVECSKIWHSWPYQLTLQALYQLTLQT